MNTKELPMILANIHSDSNKVSNKNSNAHAKSHIEEFQDVEINHYDLKAFKNKAKRLKGNEKSKNKVKGSSYDSIKQNSKVGVRTPECYLNIHDEKRNASTLNTQEDSPRNKRKVRRSMDNYRHPDIDNYLLQQTHYYHSLNAFPAGAKVPKDNGIKGVNLKKNANIIDKPNVPNKISDKFKGQSNSEK